VDELAKNKNHSAITHFKKARLNILDNNCIEIITDSNLQQKFIDAERAALISHLQAHFKNRYLTYTLAVVPAEGGHAEVEQHLSTKEQYLKIIEEYPLVKQLKDSLGLQLDY
jgi:DNA polymerase-3 subunit gamma/tau